MKILVCKMDGQVIEAKQLQETENITYSIIENAPMIEERVGYTGAYVCSENGEIEVVYSLIPKTDMQLMQEKINELERANADLLLLIAGGGN